MKTMIQPTDLRIGNYVFDWVKRIAIVDSIHKDGSIRLSSEGNYKHESFKSDRLSPIPLTEEILLKCGFEWVDEIKGYADSLHCVIRGIDSYKFVPFCTRDKDCEIPIKFVHSLQNIYFCVTNKELCVDI